MPRPKPVREDLLPLQRSKRVTVAVSPLAGVATAAVGMAEISPQAAVALAAVVMAEVSPRAAVGLAAVRPQAVVGMVEDSPQVVLARLPTGISRDMAVPLDRSAPNWMSAICFPPRRAS